MTINPAEEDAAIARADALDAQGRHGDAIDTLAGAAQRGGSRALGRIGARLLLGDRAPHLGPEGAGMVREAAEAGDPEAAALGAAMAAMGVHQTVDWRRALSLAVRAAARGSATAQGALRALSAEADAAAPAATPRDWEALASRIDPAAFAAAGPHRVVHGDPAILAFPDFVSPAMAAWLIARGRGRLRRAEVYNAAAARNEQGGTRTNSQASFTLLDADLAQIALQTRMAAAAGVRFSQMEAPAVLHYAPGEQFTEHFDFIDPNHPDHDAEIARSGQRVITVLVYLNEGYAGGATEFPRLGVSHAGAAREALLFVNARADGKGDVRTVHAGRPVVAGEKWIVSQFIRSRPVLPGSR